jgi:hypothetical protein
MIGIITDIIEINYPPRICKKIVLVSFENGESSAIQFTGRLRRLIIRNYKINDMVNVEFFTQVFKSQCGKIFNNKTALSIEKINL